MPCLILFLFPLTLTSPRDRYTRLPRSRPLDHSLLAIDVTVHLLSAISVWHTLAGIYIFSHAVNPVMVPGDKARVAKAASRPAEGWKEWQSRQPRQYQKVGHSSQKQGRGYAYNTQNKRGGGGTGIMMPLVVHAPGRLAALPPVLLSYRRRMAAMSITLSGPAPAMSMLPSTLLPGSRPAPLSVSRST